MVHAFTTLSSNGTIALLCNYFLYSMMTKHYQHGGIKEGKWKLQTYINM